MTVKITPRDLEKAFAVFTLLLLSDALALRSMFVAPEGSGVFDLTSPLDRGIALSQYLVLFVVLVMLGWHWRQTLKTLWRNVLIPLFAVLCVSSIQWSDFPEVTMRSSFLFASTTAFGIYFALRFTIQEQMQLLTITMGLAGTASLLLGVVMPSAAIENNGLRQGSWRGIFYHKNNLGMYMYLGATAALLTTQTLRLKWQRLLAWGAALVNVLLIVLSASKTALLVFLILMFLLPYCRVMRWRSRYLIPVVTLAILVLGSAAVWFMGNYEVILSRFGKDPTFSGRTDIWLAVLRSALERPWFGYGYDAFWVEDAGRCVGECSYVRALIHFDASSAHNGYLDLLASLGFVGLIIFSVGLATAYHQSMLRVIRSRQPSDCWPFLLLISLILYTQSESAIFNTRSLAWALYIGVALSPGIEAPQQKPLPRFRQSIWE
jgi:exopolysaccharide production protein ExoQ